ncbi:helix-turn-helix domain-containing protein [Pseudonocardia hispaniensis]|uniref:Helix-turn-helix domain-containing protein n=1 Tax=Pseudonocardia hispaniensis TaxID=904933 RepID=A0ABW1J665_9PSEU
MQDLLGRLAALDPEASLGLRVIACFDELIVGNVNTRALLSAAAALAGCTAGFHQERPARTVRVTPKGELCPKGELRPIPGAPPAHGVESGDGLTVWLERTGSAHANDAIILERLALAIRLRHGRGRRDLDNRRDLGTLLDASVSVEDRHDAAARLGLSAKRSYRVVAAPLFATWRHHPAGPEDVVPTPFGPIHALVLANDHEAVDARPSGTGVPTRPEHLHRSFRTALVALRLCAPPEVCSVDADQYGGLIAILADAPADGHQPDVDLLDRIIAHSWGAATLDALVRAGSVRQAARLSGVHHSTMQARLDSIEEILGFHPFDGWGRTRLGVAYLVWRLRHSRVLDLPAPVR